MVVSQRSSWNCPAEFRTLTSAGTAAYGASETDRGPAAGYGAGRGGERGVRGKPLHYPHLLQHPPHPHRYHLLTTVVIVKEERVLLGETWLKEGGGFC